MFSVYLTLFYLGMVYMNAIFVEYFGCLHQKQIMIMQVGLLLQVAVRVSDKKMLLARGARWVIIMGLHVTGLVEKLAIPLQIFVRTLNCFFSG